MLVGVLLRQRGQLRLELGEALLQRLGGRIGGRRRADRPDLLALEVAELVLGDLARHLEITDLTLDLGQRGQLALGLVGQLEAAAGLRLEAPHRVFGLALARPRLGHEVLEQLARAPCLLPGERAAAAQQYVDVGVGQVDRDARAEGDRRDRDGAIPRDVEVHPRFLELADRQLARAVDDDFTAGESTEAVGGGQQIVAEEDALGQLFAALLGQRLDDGLGQRPALQQHDVDRGRFRRGELAEERRIVLLGKEEERHRRLVEVLGRQGHQGDRRHDDDQEAGDDDAPAVNDYPAYETEVVD